MSTTKNIYNFTFFQISQRYEIIVNRFAKINYGKQIDLILIQVLYENIFTLKSLILQQINVQGIFYKEQLTIMVNNLESMLNFIKKTYRVEPIGNISVTSSPQNETISGN
jgi:hypothetical protein